MRTILVAAAFAIAVVAILILGGIATDHGD